MGRCSILYQSGSSISLDATRSRSGFICAPPDVMSVFDNEFHEQPGGALHHPGILAVVKQGQYQHNLLHGDSVQQCWGFFGKGADEGAASSQTLQVHSADANNMRNKHREGW